MSCTSHVHDMYTNNHYNYLIIFTNIYNDYIQLLVDFSLRQTCQTRRRRQRRLRPGDDDDDDDDNDDDDEDDDDDIIITLHYIMILFVGIHFTTASQDLSVSYT